ncbi:DUF2867 domain-containing protein [Kribbella sp. CA-294648]|uniref:DUF2867 domain-containing protein n=1 Tax=Kribbella sp. CA-294648 TaxID=3239948 RepID=UPI003D8EA6ED
MRRLPIAAHTSQPWRIHEVAPDFEVEDVWVLRTPGGANDFPRLVALFASDDWPESAPLVVRFLWQARWKLGALFGWDAAGAGVGSRVTPIRDRLPGDLREAPTGPQYEPFVSVFQLEREWVAELANRTVHCVFHLGWVPDGAGGYRGQMAGLVKPNGRLGRAYMSAIKPLRYLIVYPVLVRRIEREWMVAAINVDPVASDAERPAREE